MGVLEKIKEIEEEMSRTQKNKATNYHLGTLKAKLARLRSDLLIEQSGGSGGGGGEGFDVARLGDARVALIGFPSVGKSTLLSTLTETKSEVAAYEFTTLTCVPGTLHYKGSRIQGKHCNYISVGCMMYVVCCMHERIIISRRSSIISHLTLLNMIRFCHQYLYFTRIITIHHTSYCSTRSTRYYRRCSTWKRARKRSYCSSTLRRLHPHSPRRGKRRSQSPS